MDMLKKFEEESLELEEGGESGEEEGEGEGKGDEERMALEERLEGLDLGEFSARDSGEGKGELTCLWVNRFIVPRRRSCAALAGAA